MTFSQSKQMTLRPQKEKKMFTFLVALFTAACLFVPYMLMSEGYFTFYGDFNVQQIPFYQICHQAIHDGNVNWNWLTDLGSDFVGAYAFYTLGSPFFWVTLIFPNSFVPYLMGPLLILKFAFAALTAYMYIRRFTKTAYAASLGGLLYAFSGFSIYNIFFNHFHEAIIAFPLLLLAMELLLTENRRGVFALAVAFCAITNYFFFFGMVVFCVIYFFVRLCSKAIKVKLSRFLVFALEAVLGLALSAAFLVPALNAIMGNSRISNVLLGWNGITYGKEQIYLNIVECFFFPPDIPARPVFFPGANVKWSSLGGWLPVFSMTGFFTWFKLREKSWLKRVLAICVLCAMVPILNSAFYAFNVSYYARWFYMPVLMICLATVMLTEDRSVDWRSGFRWNAAITAAIVLVVGFFPQKIMENGKEKIILGLYTQDREGDYTYLIRFGTTCLIAVVCVLLQKPLFDLLKKNRTHFYKVAIACVCLVSVIYGNVFIASGRSHSYDIKNVMIDSLIEEEIDLGDESNFRIDVYDGVDNTGMYLGYPTINAFHSVVSPSIMEFYDYIGVERSVASRPDTDIPAIRSLLSVKYLINRIDGDSFVDDIGETRMPDYEYVKTSGNYYVYENQNYVPYGFSYNYYMSYDFCNSYSDESKTRLMLKAMLLTDDQIKKYGEYMTDIDTLGSGYDADATTLSFTDTAMAYDAETLRDTAADNFSVDNYGFSATVTRDEKSLVFFSVPYDEGWTAYVNDKQVEVEKVNVGFMAVPVEEGESKIRFNYRNTGLTSGATITITAVAVFAVYMLISLIWLKKNLHDTVYPEGDQLLDVWQADDIAESAFEIKPTRSIFDSLDEEFFDTKSKEIAGGFTINEEIFDEEKTTMKLKYDFVVNRVAGEIVAVSVGNTTGSFNGYIKLNETGAFVFNALKKDTTREDIINALLKEYPDATYEIAAQSVDELIEKLKKADLLV